MPRILVSFLPVVAFLALLVVMDSFKLAPLRTVLRSLAVGAAAALPVGLVNGVLLDVSGLSSATFAILVAPVVEETAKAAYVAWLVRRDRVGFLVDAAIHGFAVGCGFALLENLEYLATLGEASPVLWIARGFGTALLHGSATTVFALLSRSLMDRHLRAAFVPGWLAAIALHAVYNRFGTQSLAGALLLLIALPLVVVFVFERSEHATRSWLGVGFDTDAELLRSIVSGEIAQTRVGAYLRSLRSHFDGEVVADMLCLLRIRAELSMRAKGLLIAREAGLDVPVGEDVRASLSELRYLEKSIGRTGLLAMHPVQTRSRRDLWELYLLEQA